MREKPKRANWPIVAALLLAAAALPLTVYVQAYFAMGDLGTVSTQYESNACRIYSAQWQAAVFWPAARVESFFAGHHIKTAHTKF